MRKSYREHPLEIARQRVGLSRKGLASAAGISVIWYRRLVYGGGLASEEVAKKLAEVLNLPLNRIPHKKISLVNPDLTDEAAV